MNPFKKNGQMLPIASINSVYVDDVLASDLFRATALKEVVDQNRENLGISKSVKKRDLLNEFYMCLDSNDELVNSTAKRLSAEFGDRLAAVIVTLKKPSKLSKENRIDWTEEHWKYWSSITKLYLLGGLTSSIMAKIFYERISYRLKENNITDLQVIIKEDSNNSGTMGLAKIAPDGDFLLFDFGQTNIKKRFIKKIDSVIVIDTVLPMTRSSYLMYKDIDEQQLKIAANQLHNFIVGTIYKTIKHVDFKGNEIHCAIANYVYDGAIYGSRGGYGKLAVLSDNYAISLTKEISSLVGRKIDIILHHDTTSMSYNFKSEENAAVLSLGTAFGVAFIGD